MTSSSELRFAPPVVRLTREQHERIVAHCYFEYPNEACGLLLGPATGGEEIDDGEPTGLITDVFPTRNEAASSRVYRVHGQDYGNARKAARAGGVSIVGCWHSHTHTDAYPSPTDVEAAAYNPGWLYLLVSLRDEAPVLRAYRIQDGTIRECQVAIVG
jgi:proteasome lid subunit RPN8/RPN11